MSAQYWIADELGDLYGPTPPPGRHCAIPYHYAYMCRWCGEVWFRRWVPTVPGFKVPWMVYTMVCRLCGDGRVFPALLLEEVNVLPEQMVRRELLLELDRAQRELEPA